MQNDNSKLKINKIQTPVIASPPEVSGDKKSLTYFVIARSGATKQSQR